MERSKKIIVLGSGNSGSGAIYDYLTGRPDISMPLDKEFRLIQDPGGLADLHDAYSLGYHPQRASETINEFIDFCNRCGRSNRLYGNYFNARYGNGYAKLLHNYFQRVDDFLGSICERVDDEIQKSGDVFPFLNVVKDKFADARRRVNGKLLVQGHFVPTVDETEFLKKCEWFLNELFPLSKAAGINQSGLAIDQGGSYWSPESSTVYYGKNRKVIVVSRDPRGVFNSLKTKGLGYPGNDVHLFCKWYRSIMNHVHEDEWNSVHVTHVQYENFVIDFDKEKQKLDEFLEIDTDIDSDADMEKSAYNATKYQHLLTTEENKIIRSELSEFLNDI